MINYARVKLEYIKDSIIKYNIYFKSYMGKRITGEAVEKIYDKEVKIRWYPILASIIMLKHNFKIVTTSIVTIKTINLCNSKKEVTNSLVT